MGAVTALAGQELLGELEHGQHDGEDEQQDVEGALGYSHERGHSWPGPGQDAAAQSEGVVEISQPRVPEGGYPDREPHHDVGKKEQRCGEVISLHQPLAGGGSTSRVNLVEGRTAPGPPGSPP